LNDCLQFTFKAEMDEDAGKAMFPQNARATLKHKTF